MKKKIKQEIKKEAPIKKEEVKPPVKEKELPKLKETIIETVDRNAIATLEKQGFVVTEVLSEIKGERPKTWILKKGAL